MTVGDLIDILERYNRDTPMRILSGKTLRGIITVRPLAGRAVLFPTGGK